ncbi:hypothetical protein F441_05966 [Phytophthora nicotianae CJ01A1]|uniref:Uncharacterized protein n=6 Tax=Phytophthora nicotianae TaxID=4792 RepID=W2ZPV4_PHYNI|nr:hypothetical protein PPTG_02125 [Phytophthora nicotianae INRA-310]ETI50520.1 hypothetical protein F443_05964 [Phytophthora nicotianae P1569]ETK90400.1 hypothetical protein L915_05839 [Phytophthora nicotianae]ETO79268.1 hypothetical protein F444_06007 [Phytophthora nicotianae P1976]ETP20251.1 hypothetical protein F441_05980 [Phytophthora nicotianae CJ01A1]ETP48194.1 hypothetical protein F442_06004 [Phytophthora nicotianae P10297]
MDTRDLRLAQIRKPSHTKKAAPVGTGLPSLTPSSLLPESYSRHTQRVAKLKQICEIQALGQIRGSDHRYNIVVHTLPSFRSNIPTTQLVFRANAHSRTATHDPDLIVEKTLDEFAKLRDDLYNCSNSSHVGKSCEFCNEVAKCFRARIWQPGTTITRVLPTEMCARVATEFLEMLLRLATSCPSDIRVTCRCQEQLPRQLHKFLFEADE